MKTNDTMANAMLALLSRDIVLQGELSEIAQSPILEVNGCFLLEWLHHKRNGSVSDFFDKTSYEIHVNKFHVDGYIEKDLLPAAVSIGLSVLRRFNAGFPDKEMRCIISIDDTDCTVGFHLMRTDEGYLGEDLNEYRLESILAFDTSDAIAVLDVDL